jgi:hypothetical protein
MVSCLSKWSVTKQTTRNWLVLFVTCW